ncbi:MAG: hypothetical protein LBF94_03875 [Puniceicoccales bacterium]|nr:hypothetical protein [Puniceicoccales bacterium]
MVSDGSEAGLLGLLPFLESSELEAFASAEACSLGLLLNAVAELFLFCVIGSVAILMLRIGR